MRDKTTKKAQRILYIFYRLVIQGDKIKNEDLKDKIEKELGTNISQATLRRDRKEIEAFFKDFLGEWDVDLAVDRNRALSLEDGLKQGLTKKDLFAIAKVIVGTRAFNKEEIEDLLEKMSFHYQLTTGEQSTKYKIKKLMGSEHYNYEEIMSELGRYNVDERIDKLWDFKQALEHKQTITFKYKKEEGPIKTHEDKVPLGILFSKYYFYLIVEGYNGGEIIYRVDRIIDYELSERGEVAEYARDKFNEGEFKNRTVFMINGNIHRLRFRYYGPSLSAVLNEIPTTDFDVTEKEDYQLVETTINGWNGVKMFLLSQWDNIEVLQPQELRQDMKETIEDMLQRYQD